MRVAALRTLSYLLATLGEVGQDKFFNVSYNFLYSHCCAAMLYFYDTNSVVYAWFEYIKPSVEAILVLFEGHTHKLPQLKRGVLALSLMSNDKSTA